MPHYSRMYKIIALLIFLISFILFTTYLYITHAHTEYNIIFSPKTRRENVEPQKSIYYSQFRNRYAISYTKIFLYYPSMYKISSLIISIDGFTSFHNPYNNWRRHHHRTATDNNNYTLSVQ